MRSRLLTLTAALVLAVGGLLAVSASPAAAGTINCGSDTWKIHPDLYNRGGIQFQSVTLLYDAPSTECTIINRGFLGEGINVHCKVVANSERWYWVEDTTSGAHGWASRPNLTFNTNNTVNDCS